MEIVKIQRVLHREILFIIREISKVESKTKLNRNIKEIWKNFAESLETKNIGATVKEVTGLVNSVKNSFRSYAGALGALYAFEAQQPATASSKLEGLKKHYSQWEADETYFTIHQADFEEPALLEEKINVLSKEEKLVAALACEETSSLLWSALTGIMEKSGVHCLN